MPKRRLAEQTALIVILAGLVAGVPVLADAQGADTAAARDRALLDSPGTFDFAPQTPPVPVPTRPGGVASMSVGSRGAQSTGIRLDSGPLGGRSTQAFLSLQQGQSPSFAGGRWRGASAAAGVETVLGEGFRVGLGVETARDRWVQTR
ncbi:hypothetical protein [Rhizosaccharibacter radicis]|uniref:Autotransporter domain-containing protein n=1 Tax=Rhizosaccharibacter radicis TaxID=2782605 RepID=A0ABT1W393_9PROT|nr:hypothetical protein [Acetobacteraceae bacterium KSS12]